MGMHATTSEQTLHQRLSEPSAMVLFSVQEWFDPMERLLALSGTAGGADRAPAPSA